MCLAINNGFEKVLKLINYKQSFFGVENYSIKVRQIAVVKNGSKISL